MIAWLTARSPRKRYGRFTLHRATWRGQTYCGNVGIEVRHRAPAEMLDDDKFNPCGRCWSRITWGTVKVEGQRRAAEQPLSAE